jgi:hypothetical protein
VTLFVDLSIELAGRLAVRLGWDHGSFSCGCQRCDDPCVGIKSLVGDQRVGLHRRQEMVSALQIMGLAAGQEETHRVSKCIDLSVDLGAQSATRSPDRLVLAVFFWRRRYADGRARWCCRSSRIRCRHPRQDTETPSPRHQTSPIG